MGFSFWHFMILTGIVIMVFGPSRLPEVGRSVGEMIRGFKKGLHEDAIDVTESAKKIDQKDGKPGDQKASSGGGGGPTA